MKDRQRWQPEEDALLRSYVKQYGPKEWCLLSQRMSKPLDRDPKSCLERWKNYLKPGIKKGSLSPDEQSLVISLQAKYGNKWKKIAAEVPGRTAKRLGKWWEVFKEKQSRQLDKRRQQNPRTTDCQAVAAVSGSGSSPESVVQGTYDHILETFAEKYVQPRVLAFQSLPLPVMPNISIPQPPPPPHPVSIPEPTSFLPAWMILSGTTNKGSATSSLTSSSSSSSTTTPSPSVNLTLSPPEPAFLDTVHSEPHLPTRFIPVHQMGTLVQYCKEVEEGRQNWVHHKKEATWRLNRLEQQLESEKGRKLREKMEEIEEKIRCLREEEKAFLDRLEIEYKEEVNKLERNHVESKEAKMIEAWTRKQAKLGNLIGQIGVFSHRFSEIS